jgi:hypothetical protein
MVFKISLRRSFYRPFLGSLLAATLMSGMSGSAFAQSCVASDQRDPIEQLDCFCNPKDKSPVQQAVDALGPFSKKFGVNWISDCVTATTFAVQLSKNSDSMQAVSKEFGALGYSGAQSAAILGAVKRRVDYINNYGKRCTETQTGGYSLGPIKFFSYSKTVEVPCSKQPELSGDEIAAVGLMSIETMRARASGEESFQGYFSRLNAALDIVSHYPEARISSCFKLTSDPKSMTQCLESPASAEKLEDCASLHLLESSAVSCLQTKANHDQLLACKNLHLLENETLQCLNKDVAPEVTQACGSLHMLDQYTVACMDVGATPEKIIACGQLHMLDDATYQCLRSPADPAKVAKCAAVPGLDFDKVECLGQSS